MLLMPLAYMFRSRALQLHAGFTVSQKVVQIGCFCSPHGFFQPAFVPTKRNRRVNSAPPAPGRSAAPPAVGSADRCDHPDIAARNPGAPGIQVIHGDTIAEKPLVLRLRLLSMCLKTLFF